MESFEQIYIGGKFVDTDDGKSYDNINPATEEPLGRAPDAQLSDTRRAIETARGSFDSGVWSDASLEERARDRHRNRHRRRPASHRNALVRLQRPRRQLTQRKRSAQ